MKCEGDALPEECITNILSRTTPLDASRLSLVSKTFCFASRCDVVWDHFLPSDLISIISRSDSHSSLLANSPSKKSLYLALSENPIIIDHGTKSFQLDKKSGKKCYMLAARCLIIDWGDYPEYSNWKNLPESRFPEVAELIHVCWIDIQGVINTCLLSPKTHYTAYFVFKLIDTGVFYCHHMLVSVKLEPGDAKLVPMRFVDIERPNDDYLRLNLEERQVVNILVGLNRPLHNPVQRSHVRSDGWFEIEIGDFYVSGMLDSEVKMRVMKLISSGWMRGLIIEGIEVRPKEQR